MRIRTIYRYFPNEVGILRARGVQISDRPLHAVCRTFSEMLDTLSILTGTHVDEGSDAMVEEQRLALKTDLANCLDRPVSAIRHPRRGDRSRAA